MGKVLELEQREQAGSGSYNRLSIKFTGLCVIL